MPKCLNFLLSLVAERKLGNCLLVDPLMSWGQHLNTSKSHDSFKTNQSRCYCHIEHLLAYQFVLWGVKLM